MGDPSIPFFKLPIACATRFHTRHDALGYRVGRFHLPVVSFSSCPDSISSRPL